MRRASPITGCMTFPAIRGAERAVAAGIDLGGTKIAAGLFDTNGALIWSWRSVTPRDYRALLDVLADLRAHLPDLPIGLGTPGVKGAPGGLWRAANLALDGQCFDTDLRARLGPVALFNDAHALAVAEARFGAGRGRDPALTLSLGTGVGAGIVLDGQLVTGAHGIAGEVGQSAAPAHLVAAHNLPLVPSGTGRVGCIETLISGPGLTRLDAALTGQGRAPEELACDVAVLAVWHSLVADLIWTLTLAHDPEIVVLAGGLSALPGTEQGVRQALKAAAWEAAPLPEIALATGGPEGGARGAAFAALEAVN